ncbi:LacI family DNA-binding transcriptional regulator, partial [Cellulomonas sp.]|nr:LacI family DNA-binding transcriptional regulator [Cellulomonas sp.]
MATIRDVAADAGVAPSTVSNVLSGRKRFPDATVA